MSGGPVSMMSGTTEFAPHVLAGKLRILANMGAERAAASPDVPTLHEADVNIVNESPFCIGVPRGTNAAVIKRPHHTFRASLDEPTVQAAFARFQLPLIPMGSTEHETFARRPVDVERTKLTRLGLLRKD